MDVDETPTIPGEHETEPDLDIEQENPDLELPEDDEDVAFEPVTEDDLPEVDPHGDDEAILVEEEN